MGWAARKLHDFAARRGWLAQGLPRPGDADDFWYEGPGRFGALSISASGVAVTPESAMRTSAVWACVQLISKSVAALPLEIFRTRPDGGKDLAKNHPLYDLLHDQPNSWLTAFDFRQMLQAHLLLRGNAYAQIIPGRRGAVDSLVPLHPDLVRPIRIEGGGIGYELSTSTGTKRLTQAEVFHLRWLPMDGLKGISPIDAQREPIGRALAVQEHGSSFFKNYAAPGGTLKHPKVLSDKARANLKQSWQEMHAGLSNAWQVAILEEGVEWTPVTMTMEQAQYIETQKFSITDIARIFNVPPHLIGDLDRATFSNIEQQNKEFLDLTLRPWLVCWVQAIKRDLIVGPQFIAEFDSDQLVVPPFKERMDGYAVGINNGILSPDEARSKEGLNSRPGGDRFYQQLNLAPSDGKAPTAPARPAPGAPGQPPGADLERIVRAVVAEELASLALGSGGTNGHANGAVHDSEASNA